MILKKDFFGVLFICLLVFLTGISCSDSDSGMNTSSQDEWIQLFNGENLDGWEQYGGEANFTVENGTIVGTTVYGTPNSFLCTEKDYGDFILELELKVDPELNSGVQIRSHTYKDDTTFTFVNRAGGEREITLPKGTVYGYQVEVDPSNRAWSGGVFDEARRGWLDDLSDKPKAQKAFKNGAWNKYRIEAVGDTIRTWVNGVPAASLTDTLDSSGFIGLQVHRVREKKALQVRWRDIRIKPVQEI